MSCNLGGSGCHCMSSEKGNIWVIKRWNEEAFQSKTWSTNNLKATKTGVFQSKDRTAKVENSALTDVALHPLHRDPHRKRADWNNTEDLLFPLDHINI